MDISHYQFLDVIILWLPMKMQSFILLAIGYFKQFQDVTTLIIFSMLVIGYFKYFMASRYIFC